MAANRTMATFDVLPATIRCLGNARIADRVSRNREIKQRTDDGPQRDIPAGCEAPAGAPPVAVPARRRLAFAIGASRTP